MIERLIITNTFAQQIVADLIPKFSATAPRYTIEDLSGHGPVAAELSNSPNPGSHGVTYHRSRVGARNLVITLGYNRLTTSFPSVSERRRDIYEVMPPTTKVSVTFVRKDLPSLNIEGIVESVDPDLFSAEPRVVISIMCADPYFDVSGRIRKTVNSHAALSALPLGSGDTDFRIFMTGIPITTSYVEFSNGAGETIRAESLSQTSGNSTTLDISTFAGDRYIEHLGGPAFHKLKGSLRMSISASKPLSVKTSHGGFIPFQIEYHQKEVGV